MTVSYTHLVCPKTEEGLIRGLEWCREKKISFYVIGNGSNLLVGDKGFRGVVFQVCKNLDAVETEITPSGICVRAGAGVMLAKLARDVSARGYTGFEDVYKRQAGGRKYLIISFWNGWMPEK